MGILVMRTIRIVSVKTTTAAARGTMRVMMALREETGRIRL
jgi:hypothetical protein